MQGSGRRFPAVTDVVASPQPPRVDNVADWPGVIHTRLADVEAKLGKNPPWSIYVTRDEVTTAQLINSPPGEGNHHHTHSAHDEWWIIMSGVTEFHLTGGKRFIPPDRRQAVQSTRRGHVLGPARHRAPRNRHRRQAERAACGADGRRGHV
jgi:mannose-6-phosphate isomerase-like protein (cupin superfamily)